MESTKYGRTYHFPFSPGTSSNDRFNYEYWKDIQSFSDLLYTEKLDGENNCLSRRGVFARSHAAPTTSPWTARLREHWGRLKNDLGNLEFFGENLYAVHSIEYTQLEHYYYVFAVRVKDTWLSWEEVSFYAALFDLPLVPLLRSEKVADIQQIMQLEETVQNLASQPSVLGSIDPRQGTECTSEGLVCRNADAYPVSRFQHNVFKYVRKGHVQTDEHWTKSWKRTKLIWERRIS
ncbi:MULTISPECIES: RNA ligase family protein [Sphingobacterium]|uniref:2'-5' RNA ligase n=1 Tax=Sphingobacterium athyrii TaxID=2152717 RepID=A0A363NVD4_9SPHI|nr:MULTISPECIES: RNA ligase family protein [Sphingobacterium]PUV24766.1 2'-5' RNA ligase [Sphingobacterium athyrii]